MRSGANGRVGASARPAPRPTLRVAVRVALRVALRVAVASALAMGALAPSGCATPAAPGPAEISLREVLRTEPEDVRALGPDARARLRERFERAMLEQRVTERVADDVAQPTTALVSAFDDARAEREQAALVLLAVERAGGGSTAATAELRTLVVALGDGGVAAEEHVDFVIEDDAHILDEAMLAAIDGPARPWLERMARDRGVIVLAPAPLAPAAILGDDARVHVSPTWLALFSPDEEGDVATGSAALIYGPVGHHTTSSSGFGCYESCSCSTGSWFGGGGSSCDCNYCGFDWGLCASECGPEGEGCHCRAPHPPRSGSGSPLDPVWIALPAAYLLLRRRPR